MNTESAVPQPLDTLMNELGLTSKNLVSASREQLTFKNVQQGRSGRRISINIQDKILNALLAVKPDLKLRRRELFHYDMPEESVEGIHKARALVAKGKVKVVAETYKLDEIAKAYERVEQGKVRFRAVITT